MKKETYSFAQILLALYQKYANNQAMLKELKDYIEITPNKKIADVNFVPRFEFYDQMPREKIVYHDKLIKLEFFL